MRQVDHSGSTGLPRAPRYPDQRVGGGSVQPQRCGGDTESSTTLGPYLAERVPRRRITVLLLTADDLTDRGVSVGAGRPLHRSCARTASSASSAAWHSSPSRAAGRHGRRPDVEFDGRGHGRARRYDVVEFERVRRAAETNDLKALAGTYGSDEAKRRCAPRSTGSRWSCSAGPNSDQADFGLRGRFQRARSRRGFFRRDASAGSLGFSVAGRVWIAARRRSTSGTR